MFIKLSFYNEKEYKIKLLEKMLIILIYKQLIHE